MIKYKLAMLISLQHCGMQTFTEFWAKQERKSSQYLEYACCIAFLMRLDKDYPKFPIGHLKADDPTDRQRSVWSFCRYNEIKKPIEQPSKNQTFSMMRSWDLCAKATSAHDLEDLYKKWKEGGQCEENLLTFIFYRAFSIAKTDWSIDFNIFDEISACKDMNGLRKLFFLNRVLEIWKNKLDKSVNLDRLIQDYYRTIEIDIYVKKQGFAAFVRARRFDVLARDMPEIAQEYSGFNKKEKIKDMIQQYLYVIPYVALCFNKNYPIGAPVLEIADVEITVFDGLYNLCPELSEVVHNILAKSLEFVKTRAKIDGHDIAATMSDFRNLLKKANLSMGFDINTLAEELLKLEDLCETQFWLYAAKRSDAFRRMDSVKRVYLECLDKYKFSEEKQAKIIEKIDSKILSALIPAFWSRFQTYVTHSSKITPDVFSMSKLTSESFEMYLKEYCFSEEVKTQLKEEFEMKKNQGFSFYNQMFPGSAQLA